VSRYPFSCYNVASTPPYVVVWDLQWQLIDCQRLEPAADLSGAMAAAIGLLEDMDGTRRPHRNMASFSFISASTYIYTLAQAVAPD
jgi:hypothetical protein